MKPIESPEVIFVGPVPTHEHIYSNGFICLSILYDGICLTKQLVTLFRMECRFDSVVCMHEYPIDAFECQKKGNYVKSMIKT